MSNPYDPNANPGIGQPGYGQPAPVPPGYGQPDPGPAPYGQPGYAAPGYGAPGYGAPGGYPLAGKPDNNLVWAIVTTLLCCLPLGVVAIIKSSSVDKLWAAGDVAGAQAAAEEAKRWSVWGMIAGGIWTLLVVIGTVILFAVGILGAASTATQYSYTPSYSYTRTYTYPTY